MQKIGHERVVRTLSCSVPEDEKDVETMNYGCVEGRGSEDEAKLMPFLESYLCIAFGIPARCFAY